MTKITYAVQWFDIEDNRWRTAEGTQSLTEDQGISELELHKAYYPSIDARLVKLETTTTIQQITLSTPEAS
jgi:hypothetical protein